MALAQLRPNLRAPLPAPDQGAQISPALNPLRIAALGCRAAPRLDLTLALAHATADDAPSFDSLAAALVRVLPQALNRRVRFYPPGCTEVSFDEAWLIAALDAAARDDGDSLVFLLSRGVATGFRAPLARLIRALAKHQATLNKS